MRESTSGNNEALAALRRLLSDGLARSRMTKIQLVPRTGLSRTTIHHAFRDGGPVPSAETVAALARALRLDVEKLLELRRRAEIRPVGSIDEAVREYLHAARKAVEKHPYPGVAGLPTPPPLAEVYVYQHASKDVAAGGTPPGREDPRADGEAGAGTPAGSIFHTSDQVTVLIAGPGFGKSTLLRTRVREAADFWLDAAGDGHAGLHPTIPVWVSARALASRDQQVPGVLAAATRNLSQYGRHPELTKDRFLEQPCPGARWQLLVDGLDELPNATQRRDVLEKLTNAVLQDPLRYHCVIATRPLADHELDVLGPHTPRYELQQFSPHDLHAYTAKYFSTHWPPNEARRRAGSFIEALRAAGLAELARTPLMAFMLCQLHLSDPERSLPQGRTAVYEAFTGLLYEANQHKHVAVSHEEAVQHLADAWQTLLAREEVQSAARKVYAALPELISYLAHQWLVGRRASISETLASHEAVRRPNKVAPLLWQSFLEDLLRHTGLLVHQVDGPDFPHQTFLEYHAAQHATRHQQARRELLELLFPVGKTAQVPGFEPSYLGFLLDALLCAPEAAERAEATRRVEILIGSDGRDILDFVKAQVNLSSRLPPGPTAQRLFRALEDHGLEGYPHVQVTEVLSRVDGCREVAAQILIAIADYAAFNNAGRGYLRIRAAEALARVYGFRQAGVDRLIGMADEVSLHIADRADAAGSLSKADGFRKAGARRLVAFADDTALAMAPRAWAAQILSGVDGYREDGIRRLIALAHDPAYGTTERVATAARLARVDGCLVMSAELLLVFARNRTLESCARVQAAEALSELAGYRDTGAELLLCPRAGLHP